MGAMGGDSAHTAKPGNRRSKVYLEVMRIIAICLVVFCHMSAYTDGFVQTLESPAGWLHAFECLLARTAVPLFFMISGALLLGRRESIATVWKSVGAGVFFVMLTENLWRKLFAPWFPHEADWSLVADARAWCYVACVVGCALIFGALLKRVPILPRII